MSGINKLWEKRIRQLPALSQEEAGWIRCMGQKGSSDSDTAIWDDADRQTEPSGKALGRILAAVFHRICLHIGQLLRHK